MAFKDSYQLHFVFCFVLGFFQSPARQINPTSWEIFHLVCLLIFMPPDFLLSLCCTISIWDLYRKVVVSTDSPWIINQGDIKPSNKNKLFLSIQADLLLLIAFIRSFCCRNQTLSLLHLLTLRCRLGRSSVLIWFISKCFFFVCLFSFVFNHDSLQATTRPGACEHSNTWRPVGSQMRHTGLSPSQGIGGCSSCL